MDVFLIGLIQIRAGRNDKENSLYWPFLIQIVVGHHRNIDIVHLYTYIKKNDPILLSLTVYKWTDARCRHVERHRYCQKYLEDAEKIWREMTAVQVRWGRPCRDTRTPQLNSKSGKSAPSITNTQTFVHENQNQHFSAPEEKKMSLKG